MLSRGRHTPFFIPLPSHPPTHTLHRHKEPEPAGHVVGQGEVKCRPYSPILPHSRSDAPLSTRPYPCNTAKQECSSGVPVCARASTHAIHLATSPPHGPHSATHSSCPHPLGTFCFERQRVSGFITSAPSYAAALVPCACVLPPESAYHSRRPLCPLCVWLCGGRDSSSIQRIAEEEEEVEEDGGPCPTTHSSIHLNLPTKPPPHSPNHPPTPSPTQPKGERREQTPTHLLTS